MKFTLFLFSLFFSTLLFSQNEFKKRYEDIMPIKVGEKIGNVVLKDKMGTSISFSDVVKDKKTILIIYRGGWCPYCNEHLGDIAEIEEKLTSMNFQIIAVSPDAPKILNQTSSEDKLNYSLYSDEKGDLINALGVGYKVKNGFIKSVKSIFKGIKNDFLPVPSLFIVDKNSTVLFEYISSNYKERISSDTLLIEAEKYEN